MAENGKGFGVVKIPGLFNKELRFDPRLTPDGENRVPFSPCILIEEHSKKRWVHYVIPLEITSNTDQGEKNGYGNHSASHFILEKNEDGIRVILHDPHNGTKLSEITIEEADKRLIHRMQSNGTAYRIFTCMSADILNGALLPFNYGVTFAPSTKHPFMGRSR